MNRAPRTIALLLVISPFSMAAQDNGYVSLVRTARSETRKGSVLTDLQGTWTGTITVRSKVIPLSLVLRTTAGTLTAAIGQDPKHLVGWPVSVANGVVLFPADPVSQASLKLENGLLVGQIKRMVSDARPNVRLPDETAGFDQIVRVLISAF